VPLELVANATRLCRGVLQPLRDAWRAPIIVVSGYRTADWNRRVGGAQRSTHLDASGADVRPVEPHMMLKFVQELENLIASLELPALGGIGVYSGWVHLDTRQAADRHLRRWSGRGQGSER